MTLTRAEVERFIDDGFVILREAFPRDVAADGRAFVSELLGLAPDAVASAVDRAAIAARLSAAGTSADTYGQPMVHIRRSFSGALAERMTTPRVRAAVDDLLGAGRSTVVAHTGWWPILFPGFPGPGGWHVDGDDFHHHLTSREQGLVTLFLFSDVGDGDGGTPIVRGSHRTIARVLADAEPGGLTPDALRAALPAVDEADVVAVTGGAGDVALLHPFVIHGFGPNRGHRVRVACTPRYQLSASMQLERADGGHSPVEEAIRRALQRA